jgi:hypothetical protein
MNNVKLSNEILKASNKVECGFNAHSNFHDRKKLLVLPLGQGSADAGIAILFFLPLTANVSMHRGCRVSDVHPCMWHKFYCCNRQIFTFQGVVYLS